MEFEDERLFTLKYKDLIANHSKSPIYNDLEWYLKKNHILCENCHINISNSSFYKQRGIVFHSCNIIFSYHYDCGRCLVKLVDCFEQYNTNASISLENFVNIWTHRIIRYIDKNNNKWRCEDVFDIDSLRYLYFYSKKSQKIIKSLDDTVNEVIGDLLMPYLELEHDVEVMQKHIDYLRDISHWIAFDYDTLKRIISTAIDNYQFDKALIILDLAETVFVESKGELSISEEEYEELDLLMETKKLKIKQMTLEYLTEMGNTMAFTKDICQIVIAYLI